MIEEKISPEYVNLIEWLRLDEKPDDTVTLSLHRKGITDRDLPFLERYVQKRGWKIRELNLKHNKLTKVIDFSGFPDLEVLHLEYNFLTEVPDFPGPNLKILWILGNQLTHVPHFTRLIKLEQLDLRHNKLIKVPDFQLPALTFLVLCYNKIDEVPDFSGLPTLVDLGISGNQLKTVPDFSHLPNLERLHLSDNKLTQVPDFIFLPKLKALTLLSNPIDSLSPRIKELTTEVIFYQNGDLALVFENGKLLYDAKNNKYSGFVQLILDLFKL